MKMDFLKKSFAALHGQLTNFYYGFFIYFYAKRFLFKPRSLANTTDIFPYKLLYFLFDRFGRSGIKKIFQFLNKPRHFTSSPKKSLLNFRRQILVRFPKIERKPLS